jgi:hypothetical protein
MDVQVAGSKCHFFSFQIGYFVGGVASLESGEIAGIAVTLTAIALVLLVLLLVFLVRHKNCPTIFLREKERQRQKHDTLSVVPNGHQKTPQTNGHTIHHQNMVSFVFLYFCRAS